MNRRDRITYEVTRIRGIAKDTLNPCHREGEDAAVVDTYFEEDRWDLPAIVQVIACEKEVEGEEIDPQRSVKKVISALQSHLYGVKKVEMNDASVTLKVIRAEILNCGPSSKKEQLALG